MTPALALLAGLAVALICVTIAYVARLHYADRAHDRSKIESAFASDVDAFRRKLSEVEKTAREAHVMAAARATGRTRN